MNYLTNLFGPNAPLAATFIAAFAVVLVLIGLMAWVFRLVRGRGLGLGVGSRGRQPRLAVLDYADVDQRRKLVLIRRDNVEHLLLLGGPTDVVVETAIVRGVPVQASALRETAPEPVQPPVPMPVQEPQQPRMSMRETARQAAGEPTPALRPVNLDNQPAAPAPRPEPARIEPVRTPPRPVAPPRPEPAARPEPVARPEPPRVEPVRPEPPKVAPVVTPPPRPVTPPPAAAAPTPPPARPAPPADDVAARLEAALRKPIGATPPPRAAEPRPVAPPRPAAPPPPATNGGNGGNGGKTLSADEKSVFDSLEEEMAALLGRGPTPPKT